jgi:hypothetical protein
LVASIEEGHKMERQRQNLELGEDYHQIERLYVNSYYTLKMKRRLEKLK